MKPILSHRLLTKLPGFYLATNYFDTDSRGSWAALAFCKSKKQPSIWLLFAIRVEKTEQSHGASREDRKIKGYYIQIQHPII